MRTFDTAYLKRVPVCFSELCFGNKATRLSCPRQKPAQFKLSGFCQKNFYRNSALLCSLIVRKWLFIAEVGLQVRFMRFSGPQAQTDTQDSRTSRWCSVEHRVIDWASCSSS